MDTSELTYPVFETNQVLSSAHLNDLFEYLDEQTRLTRADLVGIGIVCGLDVAFEAPGTVHLSRGCGVTSQGYLVVEPSDLTLAHARPYTLPLEYGYQPFMTPNSDPVTQLDLWELFPDDDEPGAQPLATSGLVLEDKALVLFVELSKDRLRNCSPNSCDDRGAEVTSTVRRLLVDVADLDTLIAAASQLSPAYLGADLTERLQLPDLRMPRVDVPSTGRVSPEAVLHAFQDTFRQNGLAAATGAALTALYRAFRPVVLDTYPGDPFAGFTNRFGFLDAVPATSSQVLFMQYYWDLFDDLLAAYDEVRWKGLDLLCACCPPDGLFPRHLMAGVLAPETYDPADYRHRFVRSPAVGDCVERTSEVHSLFVRLVNLVQRFTETPPDKGVRATPSRWGDVPLSAKAVPYYYDLTGTPAMFELWDPVKSARGRANQNLGYRSGDFTPTPAAFVTDPLRFDLEPNDFLRIEGHLGKNVQTVLESLLAVKKSHRLPIEVVALRTGAFDENVEVDLTREKCRFRDLETLYEALRSELTCFLVKEVQYFYSLPADQAGDGVIELGAAPLAPSLWLLKTFAGDFQAQPGTLGSRIEGVITWRPGTPPPPFIVAVAGVPNLQSQVLELVSAMSDLGSRLPDDLRQVDFESLGASYRTLVEIARRMDAYRRGGAFDEQGLAGRLDDIVFRCRLDPFEAIAEEYKRRIREVKQASYLGSFLEHHPGIQHKAGVPLGGTFILVYHELPTAVAAPPPPGAKRGTNRRTRPDGRTGGRLGGELDPELAIDRRTDLNIDLNTDLGTDLGSGVRVGLKNTFQLDDAKATLLSTALARMQYKGKLAEDPDLQVLYQLITGNVLVPRPPVSTFEDRVYLDAVAGLADGAVIADFFLPYQCCSDCPPIQYQLPPARLRVTTSVGCTNSDGFSEVVLTADGASGSLAVQVDDGQFEELSGPVLLSTGDHTVVVRDATGNESSPVDVTIPATLVISGSETAVDQAAGTYSVVAALEGGTPPYTADSGTMVGATYTSAPVRLADPLTVVVKDAAGCTVRGTFESGVSPCDLPCGGEAVRQGFRFWVPEARPNLPINEYRVDPGGFTITDASGTVMDLRAEVAAVLLKFPNPIRTADYAAVVQRWLDGINEVVAAAVGSDQWLRLEYEPPTDRGTTGVLFVDHLTCVDFAFRLSVGFTQGKTQQSFNLRYAPDGTVISSPQAKLRIPPFSETSSNKCRPGEPAVQRCEGTDLALELRRDGGHPDALVLGAAFSGTDAPVAFLWEVQDGIPSVAGGEKVSLTFQPVEPVDKLVRLTAFTEKGCSVTLEEVVNILKDNG